jgi:hypothetical protein
LDAASLEAVLLVATCGGVAFWGAAHVETACFEAASFEDVLLLCLGATFWGVAWKKLLARRSEVPDRNPNP